MDSKVNYTVVGIFVITLSIAFIYAVLWLTTGSSGKNYKTYLAYMRESVSGLSIQSPVKYNGVKIGYVADISLNPKDPTQVRLVFAIESDVTIREDTTATLESQGFTGITYIGLSGGAPNSPILRVQPGEEYPVIKTKPSLFLRLDQALRNLTGNFDHITSGLQTILSKKNQENVTQALGNLQEFSNVLAKNSENLKTTLADLKVIASNTRAASDQFPGLVQQAKSGMNSLRRMADNIDNTVGKAKNIFDNIADQLTPQLYSTLQNFSDLTVNLKGLSSQLQKNPAMLIRGKVPAAAGPGENAQ